MPLLTYSYPAFTANTVILSARVNAKFTDIQTLLNTTGLDDTNIQAAGITRSTKLKVGTAGYVVVNHASTGAMSEAQYISTAQGGTGQAITLGASDANKVLKVNSGGSAFELGTSPETPSGKLFNYFRMS